MGQVHPLPTQSEGHVAPVTTPPATVRSIESAHCALCGSKFSARSLRYHVVSPQTVRDDHGVPHVPQGGAGRRVQAGRVSGVSSDHRSSAPDAAANEPEPARHSLDDGSLRAPVCYNQPPCDPYHPHTVMPMRLLDACAKKPVDATPVWLMRQAGRYLPEYRAIREKMSFVEMCRRPDVAAEVTLQPLRRFDLDAAIVFADILLPLEPMGIGFHFSKDDGPVIERPIRGARDLEGVHTIDAASDLGYVMDTLKLVRHELDPKVALIGFSGAPFTLASYIVEGGHSRNYAHVKKLMYEDPVTFNRLMSLISEVVVDYLKAQIAAGAQVVQLFDSWVGWVSPYDYELLVLPHVRYVMDAVRGLGAPVIYFGNGASAMLHLVAKAGADVYGVDWRIELDRAWDQLGDVARAGQPRPHHAPRPAQGHRGARGRRHPPRRPPAGAHLQPRPRPHPAGAAGQRQVPGRRRAPALGRPDLTLLRRSA